MTAPGDSVIVILLLALFVACAAYAVGRLHQRRQAGRVAEEAYRDGYEAAESSVFSLAARMIVPRRVRGRAHVKVDSAEATAPLPKPAGAPETAPAAGRAPATDGPTAGRPPASAAEGLAAGRPPASVAEGLAAGRPGVSVAEGLAAGHPSVAEGESPVAGHPRVPATESPSGEPLTRPVPAAVEPAGGRDLEGAKQIGFPAPPPPPPTVLPEPAAFGGVTYQPFPEPHPTATVPLSKPSAPTADAAATAPGTSGHVPASRKPGEGWRPSHRAPDQDDDEVTEQPVAAEEAMSSGRHTVPDELVRAATYQLPPDRVFRAKVQGPGNPTHPASGDQPARPAVPKPRQS